jgi:hypothetical protein
MQPRGVAVAIGAIAGWAEEWLAGDDRYRRCVASDRGRVERAGFRERDDGPV